MRLGPFVSEWFSYSTVLLDDGARSCATRRRVALRRTELPRPGSGWGATRFPGPVRFLRRLVVAVAAARRKFPFRPLQRWWWWRRWRGRGWWRRRRLVDHRRRGEGGSGVCTTGVRRGVGTDAGGGGSSLTVGGGEGGGDGGLLLIGATGCTVWLTSVGVTAWVLRCCSQNSVSPSTATNAATNRAAGSFELDVCRVPPVWSLPSGPLAEASSTSARVRSRSQLGAGMNTGAAPSNATGLTSRRN